MGLILLLKKLLWLVLAYPGFRLFVTFEPSPCFGCDCNELAGQSFDAERELRFRRAAAIKQISRRITWCELN